MSSMILIWLLLGETVHEHTYNIKITFFIFRTCQFTITGQLQLQFFFEAGFRIEKQLQLQLLIHQEFKLVVFWPRARGSGSMCDEISRCTSCACTTSEDTRCRQDVLTNKEAAITNWITRTITIVYFLAGQLELDDGVICLVTSFLELGLLNHVKCKFFQF